MSFLRHPVLEDLDHGFGVRDAEPPGAVRRPRQVHGARVVGAEACAREPRPEADAVVCERPGVRVGVVTADCLPVLIASCDGRGVAAVHAGWRGLAAGVVGAAVAALEQMGAGPGSLRAAIGPHIGPCCYEVDAPVLELLARRFGAALDRAVGPARPGHEMLDLGELAREALARAGLPGDSVGAIEAACTRCDSRRFHSYRRDGSSAGRLIHYVAARGQQT